MTEPTPIETEELLRGPDPEVAVLEGDERMANWKLRRLLALNAEHDRIADLFAVEIRDLMARSDEMLQPIADEIELVAQWLEKWHRARVAGDKSAGKTVTLPAGKLVLKGKAPAVVVEDEESLRAFMEGHADADGQVLADLVWVTPEPVEKFSKQALNGLVATPKAGDKDRPEPGSTAPAKLADGTEIPGVVIKVEQDTWSAK